MSHTQILRAGYIALIGRPNVGKSTLNNALIGDKISIISKKAQTTRYCINGILNRGESEQFVFVDTPGFQIRYNGVLNYAMNRAVLSTTKSVDVIIHVIEAGKWLDSDVNILSLLKASKTRTLLVINKIDRIKDRNLLFPFVNKILSLFPYLAVIPVSATKNLQLDCLLDEISKNLPIQNAIFESGKLTDRSAKFMAAELLREKIFRFSGDEIPYNSMVSIDQWEENSNHIDISACITVDKEKHKPILLGRKGLHMKQIATEARQDISAFLKRSIYLQVHIKVRKKWFLNKEIFHDLDFLI